MITPTWYAFWTIRGASHAPLTPSITTAGAAGDRRSGCGGGGCRIVGISGMGGATDACISDARDLESPLKALWLDTDKSVTTINKREAQKSTPAKKVNAEKSQDETPWWFPCGHPEKRAIEALRSWIASPGLLH